MSQTRPVGAPQDASIAIVTMVYQLPVRRNPPGMIRIKNTSSIHLVILTEVFLPRKIQNWVSLVRKISLAENDKLFFNGDIIDTQRGH